MNCALVIQIVAEEDGALDSTAAEDLLLQQAAGVGNQHEVPRIALVADQNINNFAVVRASGHLERC